ncbi:MAG TPA: hypothetical protein VNI84_20500 [Pyrinomonadaceae bacterium]|nr:hypothetical protein [Pyrinomonadaceae bacterium]
MKDLVVLAADKNTQFTLQGLFSRNQSLGIRDIATSSDIFVHPQRDPGCYNQCVNFLRSFKGVYNYGLVIFDREGSGQETKTREEIEAELEQQLSDSGWNDRIAVIVIEPELESWVWSDSPHVERILGWDEQIISLKDWLVNQNFLESNQVKPSRPKEAMDGAIRQVKKPHSSSIFLQLAEKVSLNRCQDNSFLKLKTILQLWFS